MRKFNNIAALIKRKRLSHPQGLSQSDLSHLLGYKNGQFISNVERALCNIPFKMMNKVCDILHITPEEIKRAMIGDYEDTIDAYLQSNDSFDGKMTEHLKEETTTYSNIMNSNSPSYNSTTTTQSSEISSDFIR
ncbi:MAG: helix-turn-helix transcriptional regulator [Halobacteriovoraceae bacterium]|nr:helix-turn-helix transcriptional regulator [Halobacteriovoraceae bacterium]MCB9095759.1 helix-turn-helix transcriptional regulator [Halobacteriovoraceae bacterium]